MYTCMHVTHNLIHTTLCVCVYVCVRACVCVCVCVCVCFGGWGLSCQCMYIYIFVVLCDITFCKTVHNNFVLLLSHSLGGGSLTLI